MADSVSFSLVELVSINFLDCSFSCCIVENFNFAALSCALSVLIFSSISDFLLAASDCSAKTFCLWNLLIQVLCQYYFSFRLFLVLILLFFEFECQYYF